MYATTEQLLERWLGATLEPNSPSIPLALQDASDYIDTFVGSKYELPLKIIPASLTRICIDIAIYYLANSDELVTEDIRKRYEDALRLLESIAKGIIKLPVQDDSGEDDKTTGAVVIEGQQRVMGRGKGY